MATDLHDLSKGTDLDPTLMHEHIVTRFYSRGIHTIFEARKA